MLPVIVLGGDVHQDGLESALAAHGLVIYRGDHRSLKRDRIVAVVDSDPEVIVAVTVRGIDAVLWDQPHNQGFPWHFRGHPDDIVAGLLRRFKEWSDRRASN